MTIQGSSGKDDIYHGAYYEPIDDGWSEDKKDMVRRSNESKGFVNLPVDSIILADSQNEKLREKYNFYLSSYPNDIQYLDVIKKLEIDIFNLQASLKLSNELNDNYEKLSKEAKEKIIELEISLEQIKMRNRHLEEQIKEIRSGLKK